MFRAPLCPSSGAQGYYKVGAACGISCCGFQVAGLVWSWGLCVRFAGCSSILQTGHITPLEARKCSAAQGPHSEVVPRAYWRLVSKSCDECKGSIARGCEAKSWSHWTFLHSEPFSSLWGLILYQMSNAFIIIKMCYVHNQLYDISCTTLYKLCFDFFYFRIYE